MYVSLSLPNTGTPSSHARKPETPSSPKTANCLNSSPRHSETLQLINPGSPQALNPKITKAPSLASALPEAPLFFGLGQ